MTLSLGVSEGEDEFLPSLKDVFEAEHPNIRVDITLIPEESYVTKIDTALAAGSPPGRLGILGADLMARTGG